MKVSFNLRADGRIHLAPYGEHPHKLGVQIFDRAAADALVSAWKNAGSRELLADFEHESHDVAKRTEAAAWLGDLHADHEGLWCRPRWSDLGLSAAQNGRYRYVSPVWDCEPLGEGRWKPVRLKDVGLTNQPNLKGLIPFSNRADSGAPSKQPAKTMNKIATALGLAESATEDEILAAIAELRSANTDFEKEVAANRTAEAEAFATARGVTDPDKRKSLVNRFVADPSGVKELFGCLPETPAKKEPEPTKPRALTNRAQAATPASHADPASAESEAARAAKIRNRAGEIQRTNPGMGWETAFNRAEREFPSA